MPIYRIDPGDPPFFPPPQLANEEGPAIVGGDLVPERLLAAYRHGYFPWYNDYSPILWWNPNPRFVLYPPQLRVSKSMRPYFNQRKYYVTYDQQFRRVMEHCRHTPRHGQEGSWINDELLEAYTALHELGFAHSVEVNDPEGRLVGGLYGIALGKVFFGESMFAHARDASKFGFISLVRRLGERGYRLIDCQQETSHLASLGAASITRDVFLRALDRIDFETTEKGPWQI